MPKVYLIAQPTVTRAGKLPNLEPLAEHGEVHTVVQAGENPTDYPERNMRMIAERLKRFDANADFVVWAGGDTLAALMVGAVLERQGVARFRWLRYERRVDPVTGNRTDDGAVYIPHIINIYPQGDLNAVAS